MAHSPTVIISYEHETDANLAIVVKQTIEGCTDNKDFTFTNELSNVVLYAADFDAKLSVMPNGGIIVTREKDLSKAKLATGMHTLCSSINTQKGGNLVALQGSGAPLTAGSLPKGTTVYPAPEGLKIKPIKVATSVDASVKPVKGLNDHGTVFAYTPVLNASDNYDDWTQRHTSSHHLTLTGLKPATKYLLIAGFQGPTGTPIVWCKPIIFGTAAA